MALSKEELKWSAQNGDLDKIRFACSQPGFDISADLMSGGGRQLIHCAADYGQVDIIKYLLKQGANVNAKDSNNFTPLLNAIYEGHTQCVKLLVENGADISVKAPSGQSLYEVADKDEIKEIIRKVTVKMN